MDWLYERLNELVESGEMTEEEARQEYREYKEEQAKEYMNECLYGEQF
jgi:polyhydroxyalkanoate synthesis regulator phasin